MYSYKSIIKADYLQRTRSYGFLIALLASTCLAYTFVPAEGAKYSTVRVGDFVGQNNAAWIGHVTAMMASTFLWLLGFYLVNNGIKRDKDTGVGQIIATTSITNFKYLLAKTFSNFLVLLTITLIVMMMALVLVFIRGGQYPFTVMQFFLPYLFITIPSIFCLSAVAVFYEVILGKYPVLQNIAFFFLFIAVVANTDKGDGGQLLDVMGIKAVTNEIEKLVNTHYSSSTQEASIGFIFSDKISIKHFLFEGTHWSVLFIISRLLWMVAAIVLVKISAIFFHRFDVKEQPAVKRKQYAANEVKEKLLLKEIQLSLLPVAAPAFGIWSFVKIEFLMLLRKGHRWFWLINLGGFIALFFMPLTVAHQIGLPVIWFLQINRWADIATKEKFYRTHYFTYAAYKPLQRLLSAQIIAGILLACLFALPVIMRYAISGNLIAPIGIIAGAVFVVAFAVCSGIIFGGSRFFEIVFFMLTYTNVNLAPPLDYFGALHQGVGYITTLSSIIIAMLAAAFLFRRYEITHQ